MSTKKVDSLLFGNISINLTSLIWLTVVMHLLKTKERLERDGSMADGLTYTNKITREIGLEGAKEMKLWLMA